MAKPSEEARASPPVIEVSTPVQKLLPDNQLGVTPSAAETVEDGTPRYSPTPVPPEDSKVNEDGIGENTEKVTGVGQGGEDHGGSEPPEPVLSESAARARLRRVCTPNSKGEYKVPEEVIQQYTDPKDGRLNLMRQFEKCGYDPDQGLTSCSAFFCVEM